MDDEEEARDILASVVQYLISADDMLDYAARVGWEDESWDKAFTSVRRKVKKLQEQVGLLCIRARGR